SHRWQLLRVQAVAACTRQGPPRPITSQTLATYCDFAYGDPTAAAGQLRPTPRKNPQQCQAAAAAGQAWQLPESNSSRRKAHAPSTSCSLLDFAAWLKATSRF